MSEPSRSPNAGSKAAGLSLAAFTCLALVLVAAWASRRQDFEIGSCAASCAETGCVADICPPGCDYLTNPESDYAVTRSLPFYRNWKEKVCRTECEYFCVLSNETKEAGLQQKAVGFREDWCLMRSIVNEPDVKEFYTALAKTALTTWGPSSNLMNESAAVILSVVNLVGTLVGLFLFVRVVRYKLPRRPITKGPYYPLAGFWTAYGVLAAFYWFCQVVLHRRNVALDKNIDTTLEVVLALFSLLLAILRVWDIRTEQSRVIVLSPLLAFLVPHVLYVNICTFDYGLNVLVCSGVYTAQYVLWVVWAGATNHPAKKNLWAAAALASVAPLLWILQFDKFWGILDLDLLWILSGTISTFLWWSFLKLDAVHMTGVMLKQRDQSLKKDS